MKEHIGKPYEYQLKNGEVLKGVKKEWSELSPGEWKTASNGIGLAAIALIQGFALADAAAIYTTEKSIKDHAKEAYNDTAERVAKQFAAWTSIDQEGWTNIKIEPRDGSVVDGDDEGHGPEMRPTKVHIEFGNHKTRISVTPRRAKKETKPQESRRGGESTHGSQNSPQ